MIWGVPLLVAFTGTGLLLSVRSGFFQITHVNTWMKTTLGSIFSKKSRESGKGSISQTQALSAALAACMGTGNIVGVDSLRRRGRGFLDGDKRDNRHDERVL